MRYRRIAVLGGSGFIGRYIVKRLAGRGAVIMVGCRNAEQVEDTVRMFETQIPASLWQELKQVRLLPEDAPTPN